MSPGKVWFALTLLTTPAAVHAASIEGPRLGVVFDPATKSLRPILGIPGAAILAEPLQPPFDLRKIVISPMQNYVLATEGEHNQVVVLNLGSAPLAATPVPGADHGPDQMVLSAGGGVAALYYKDRNRIQVFSGLPGSPRASAELYLSAGQAPAGLAAGDDGQTVLAAIGDSIYWVSPHGEVPILSGLHKVAAIALSADHTALIADSVGNQIHRVRNVTGAIEADVLAGPEDGIAAPVAVAASHDNQRAFVANAKTGMIIILDLRRKSLTKLSCGCTPTGLERLVGDDVFRLTEPSKRPMWMLEAAAHGSRILFVPDDLRRSSQK